jgi:hypothetical protein
MIGIIVGLGLFVAAWFLRQQKESVGDTLRTIQLTDTSTVVELKKIHQAIVDELGSGAFKQEVELKGNIRANNPLTSELAEEDCVYYCTHIEEEYERTYYETDDDGNRVRKTDRETRKLAGNETSIRFNLEDNTGKILVNPNHADIDALQVVDHYEPYNGNKKIKYKKFKLDHDSRQSQDHRILGYRFQEWVLRVGMPIYVLGEVNDREDQLMVQKPSDTEEEERPYIITHKTEAELIEDKKGDQTFLTFGWWGCLIGGTIAVIWGILELLS